MRRQRERGGGTGDPPAVGITLPHSTKRKLWVLFAFRRLPEDSAAALGLSVFKLAPSSGTLVFLPPSQCLFPGNEPRSQTAALHWRVGVASNHRTPGGGIRKARKTV